MTNPKQPGASTGRLTHVPSIPVVRTGDRALDAFVLAVKEYIEIREGIRGNPFDRVATMRDIAPALSNSSEIGASAPSGATVDAKKTGSAVASVETAKLRAEIGRAERSLRDALNNLTQQVTDLSLTSGEVQAFSTVSRYTREKLEEDLATGAATIIAGATSGNAVMEVAPDGSYVLFKHRLANINGLGAGYSGTVRTAVGITAAGFLAGFNRRSDGAFQPSVVIDSATGDVTILGTLKANSVIEVGAFLGSQTVSSVLSDVSNASSNAAYAASEVGSKLNKSASDILSGTISFTSAGGFRTGTIAIDGSGNVSGAGVAFTSKGIVGRNNSNTTFTLDATTGAATFAGNITSSGQFFLSGTGFIYGGTANQNTVAYINGASTIYGLVVDGGGLFTTAIYGKSTGGNAVVGSSSGVVGSVYGFNDGSGPAVQGISSGSGPGVACSGPFRWGAYTYSQPDGGTDKYLRNDGQWGLVANLGGGTVTSVSGSGSVSGITLSGTVTTSGSLTLGGSLSLTTSQLIATAPSGSHFLSGGGWITVNVVSALNGATGNVTNSFAANNSISGIAISVSGSGTNNVTYNFSSTSDRSLKKDITDIDKGLDFINQLRPVTYLWDTEHINFSKRTYGFVANEVRDLLDVESSLVYTNQGGVFDGKLAVDYQSYVPVLVKAVQELSARVAQLEQANGA